MVKLIFLFALVATSLSLTLAGLPRRERPPVLINRPPPPKPHRYAREANPQGSASFGFQKPLSGPERRPTYNVDYKHKVFENKHGHFSATGGGVRYPGRNWEPTVGVQGQWRFKREANPGQKPVSDRESRQFSVTGGGIKYPGHSMDPYIGIQGKWKF